MNTLTQPFQLSIGKPSLSRAGYIWIAVMLIVVFEGAIRKWFASSATLPLILSRDLLAVYLVYFTWRQGYFRRHKTMAMGMLAWSCCVLAWGMVQVILGESSPIIMVIGLRFWLLYLWFGFAASASMNEDDFRAAVKTTVILLLIMTPLAVIQYYSPPGARINTQIDGFEEDVFLVVAGVVRTTGTFSFTSGYTDYLAIATPLVLAVVAARKSNLKQVFFGVAVFGLLAAGTLVSGSRGAVVFFAVLLAAYLVSQLIFSRAAQKGKALIATVGVLMAVALFVLLFQDAVQTTQERFETAAGAESVAERVFTIFFGEPNVYVDFNWLGVGIGYGSNLATYVRTGATSVFVLVETEAGRTLLEGGLLGILFVGLKALVLAVGLWKSFLIAIRTGAVYPMLIWLTFALALLTWPAIAQLTANPLVGILFGLALASLKYPKLEIFRRRFIRR